MQKRIDIKQVALKGIGLLFLTVTLLIIYWVNDAVPIMMDDEWYSTRLYDSEPVRSLKDVIDAQTWHFFNWGGRSIAHGMLQLVLMTGAFGANIVNILFNIALTWVICKAAGVRGSVYFAMILGMLYGLNANWKESMCWQSGAANYLYMTTFILLFLWCYVRVLEGQEKPLPGAGIWMIPLGLVSGWSNENMGPTVWLLSFCIILYLWIKERKGYWWMLAGNITCLIGSALVILAPGNFVRASETMDGKGLLWRVFLRCYYESKAVFEYLFPTLLVLSFALFLGIGVCGIRLSKANIVYLLGALLSWGAMILSPHYPDRATFGTMVFMICVIASVVGDVMRRKPLFKPWIMAIGSVIWLGGMFLLMEYTCVMWGWIVY